MLHQVTKLVTARLTAGLTAGTAPEPLKLPDYYNGTCDSTYDSTCNSRYCQQFNDRNCSKCMAKYTPELVLSKPCKITWGMLFTRIFEVPIYSDYSDASYEPTEEDDVFDDSYGKMHMNFCAKKWKREIKSNRYS